MGISPYGTDAYLRYMLRKRLRSIKEDDKLIRAEGVDSLSEAELREDCRERGMLGLVSVEEMRQQLRDWMDLSLNHSVPSSLLILSRLVPVLFAVIFLFFDQFYCKEISKSNLYSGHSRLLEELKQRMLSELLFLLYLTRLWILLVLLLCHLKTLFLSEDGN
jgi:hypothetical protein